MKVGPLSTFKERESKEDRYAWTKFKQWLDKGKWKYKRFRYAKEISAMDISKLSMSDDQEIFLKKLLKTIDFDHDGIMTRGPETWFFDLKYKGNLRFKTWINEDDYKKYYALSEESGAPFLIIAYVHYEDKLYFHRVRGPDAEPKPKRFWDDKPAEWGGQKWVYEMPENEYIPITGFNVPFEVPKTLIDYYILCLKIEEEYRAWRAKKPFKPRPNEEYRLEILRRLEKGYPEPWSLGLNPITVPKAYTEDLREDEE